MATPSLYGAGEFYNSGIFYGLSGTDVPVDLSFYRTSQDSVYTFHWGFLATFISPALVTFNYELQLDTVPTFNSVNLVDYTSGTAVDTTQSIAFTVASVTDNTHLVVESTTGLVNGDTITQGTYSTTITTVIDSTHLVVGSTVGWIANNVITYQNGNVRKGFTVSVAARIDGVVQTWYARVRIRNGTELSDWSNTLVWTIPQKVQQQYAENLMNSLPDYHVYGKGDLLLLPNQRNSNLYLVENMYGNQLDQVYYTNYLTQTDNFITLCRDENLYKIYGVLFNFLKPTNMQYVDYRWILQNLILASLVGSTNEAIILLVQSFTGVPPNLILVENEFPFFLNIVQDNPIVPSSPQSVFHTSYPFVPGSLVVEQLSTLTVGSTAGFTVGYASDSTTLASFYITSIDSGTKLGIAGVPYISAVRQLNPGDTIVQGLSSTTISVVTEGGLVSSGSYTTNPVQGTWTMNLPTTATLQATFNIGNPIGPFPFVFDSLSGASLLTGTVTFTNGSTLVTGSGTLFSTEVVHSPAPPQITDGVGIYLGTVSSVTDNTHLILEKPWAGPTETGIAYNLLYTDIQLPPPILFDKTTLAFGIIIDVLNPGEFVLSQTIIEMLGYLILPAQVKVYWEFS